MHRSPSSSSGPGSSESSTLVSPQSPYPYQDESLEDVLAFERLTTTKQRLWASAIDAAAKLAVLLPVPADTPSNELEQIDIMNINMARKHIAMDSAIQNLEEWYVSLSAHERALFGPTEEERAHIQQEVDEMMCT